MIRGLGWLRCEQKLKALDPNTLLRYRQHGDLIEVSKILNEYYEIDITKFFTVAYTANTRGHDMKVSHQIKC